MGKKVLVVDDDPDVRLFNVTVLEEHGYTPVVATNGEEGIELDYFQLTRLLDGLDLRTGRRRKRYRRIG